MQARLMSQALRKLTAVLHKSSTLCIFSNQLREKVGVMFGNPETTPGGKALKFYASIRMDIRRKDTLKDAAGAAIGSHVKVKVVRNKVAPPFAEAEFDILFGSGSNRSADLLDLATELGIVVKKGAWFQYEGTLVGQGREAAFNALAADANLAGKIQAAVLVQKVKRAQWSRLMNHPKCRKKSWPPRNCPRNDMWKSPALGNLAFKPNELKGLIHTRTNPNCSNRHRFGKTLPN